jgi:glucose-6-phosphate 1-dehydrogenase
VFYTQGSFDDPEAYARLKERLDEIDPQFGIPGNRIFYLAIPPTLIETCVKHLKEAGLITPPDSPQFTRIIVEKPIGRDLESAKHINLVTSDGFDESQIYRIDHYLGKETVQSIMVMRFGNAIFEPLWNQKYIDHVQITVSEEEGVGSRYRYYEEDGALRDMVQNHIRQLLCLTAMEPPWAMNADVIRDHKTEVLNCLRPIPIDDVDKHIVRAQYTRGFQHGQSVPGYRHEEGVNAESTTETFVALKVFVDNWRWAGVPFYIRTGKSLPKRASEIAVQFKQVPQSLFSGMEDHSRLEPNVLALRIQPDEGFSLRIASKLPGPVVKIYPVKMDFHYGHYGHYGSTFGEQSPEAYERLLPDVMAGDATLFMRRDAVEASWTWIKNIQEGWARSGDRWLPEYPAGAWDPVESEKLIAMDGRTWRTLLALARESHCPNSKSTLASSSVSLPRFGTSVTRTLMKSRSGRHAPACRISLSTAVIVKRPSRWPTTFRWSSSFTPPASSC